MVKKIKVYAKQNLSTLTADRMMMYIHETILPDLIIKIEKSIILNNNNQAKYSLAVQTKNYALAIEHLLSQYGLKVYYISSGKEDL